MLVPHFVLPAIAIALTDFTTGLFAITAVSKLNGPAGVSPEPFWVGEVPNPKVALVGLSVSLDSASMIPFGKDDFSGDRESRLIGIPEVIVEAR